MNIRKNSDTATTNGAIGTAQLECQFSIKTLLSLFLSFSKHSIWVDTSQSIVPFRQNVVPILSKRCVFTQTRQQSLTDSNNGEFVVQFQIDFTSNFFLLVQIESQKNGSQCRITNKMFAWKPMDVGERANSTHHKKSHKTVPKSIEFGSAQRNENLKTSVVLEFAGMSFELCSHFGSCLSCVATKVWFVECRTMETLTTACLLSHTRLNASK